MHCCAEDKVRKQAKSILAAALGRASELSPEVAATQLEEVLFAYYADVPPGNAESSANAGSHSGSQVGWPRLCMRSKQKDGSAL